jgi:hypothetical protein
MQIPLLRRRRCPSATLASCRSGSTSDGRVPSTYPTQPNPHSFYRIYGIDRKSLIRDCGCARTAERRDSSRDRGARAGTALCFPRIQSSTLGRSVMAFRCPWCQSERIRRSKTRGFLEAFLAKLSVRPFRCHVCDCRFFRRSAALKSHSGKSVKAGFPTLRTPPITSAASLPK